MKKLNGNGIENINLDQDYTDFEKKSIKYGKILFDAYTNPNNPLYDEAMKRTNNDPYNNIARVCDAVHLALADERLNKEDDGSIESAIRFGDKLSYYIDLLDNVVDLRKCNNNSNGLNSPNQQIGTNDNDKKQIETNDNDKELICDTGNVKIYF